MVSFSSAAFPLSVESVGVALQCCIGGICSGFRVTPISARSFRFSVANNKVGHFIYGLKDRIWPDFVCHFHLFNGRFSRFSTDHHWHADEELSDLSSRRTVASNLIWVSCTSMILRTSHLIRSSASFILLLLLICISLMLILMRPLLLPCLRIALG